MENIPEKSTNRLILKSVLLSDIPKVIEYAGNKKIADNTLNIPHPYSEKDAIFWLNSINQGLRTKTQFTFGIRLKETDEFIGGVGLKVNLKYNKAELGYWIAEPFWNNGYATEAVGEVIKFGFNELEINEIFATHLIENPSSGRVMIKNHMIEEGILKDHIRKAGKYVTLKQYRLTKSEYLELAK